MPGYPGTMSGPKEEVTAGETSHGDSTPRSQAVKSQPPSSHDLKEFALPTDSALPLSTSLAPSLVVRLSENHDVFMGWISGLAETLSPEGKAVVRSKAFELLKEVPHSTVAHSRVMNHVNLTRWDHCIHAAHTVAALDKGGNLGLNPYEVRVTELVMLLHDPHRLGSHALDRVFASMPGAPTDFNSWWPADDYHEYHGACMIRRDGRIRTALGKYCDDVLAILTLDDRRPKALKVRDYGDIRPRLNEKRIQSLHRLKDELDRSSYLILDYILSGFKPEIIVAAVADVERHQRTLAARGSGIQLNIDEHTGPHPYNDVARLRYVYREKLATLAVGCLAERVIFHDGIWDRAKERYDARYLASSNFYEEVRERAMRGEYEAIFSDESMSLIRAAKTGRGLCVEDVYAPLATLTLADMTEVAGVSALEKTLPPGLSQSLCGVPRRDMTLFEANIRRALQEAGLDSNVHVLTSNDFGKTFEYDVSRRGMAPVKEVAHHDCHDSLIKVIVAARAIGKDGESIDLSAKKRLVENFLRHSGYLTNPKVLGAYNSRIFVDPVDPSVFSPSVREKVCSMIPVWIQRGGSGIA